MSDNADIRDEETGEAESSGPRGGERLAAARREQQIALVEIAKELHLDEYKVRALERNEFDVLGAPVFAKGHLRKYAQLVNVSTDDVLADYYKMNRQASVPPVVSTRPRPHQELSPGPWIAVIAVVILAVSAFWWLTRPIELPVTTPQEQQAEAPVETDEPAPGEIDETPPPVADDDAVVEEAVRPEPEAIRPVVEETASPEIADGQMRILLTYTGDCWTEVTDASGRRLFFALGKDGRSVELSGAEPFNVLFGSPGNVELTVNGETYELPATARPDRPLRLTIPGS